MKFNMDSSSVVSEPISTHHRNFSKQKSASMMTLNAKQNSIKYQPLPIIDPKQTNIESAVTNRHRRKNSSFGGILSQKGHNSDAKELRSALQDREAVIQNLRVQLCLGKLPRPSGPPFSESDIPAAEQKISRLKIEVENKKIAIRNLKTALDKLDITDNIDIRIRQAELEYALGREELQLLSIVEELRALQARLDKSRPEANTLYSNLVSGSNLTLFAVQTTSRSWGFHSKSESPGWYVDWASEDEGLCKGDRIIEINGKIVSTKSREDVENLISASSKCQLVVIRNKTNTASKKQLMQQMEDNLRLQHRISYLEEQVKDLQTSKENINTSSNSSTNSHVTSINISSPPTTPPEKPLVYQRGNFITTLIGGKPIEIIGEQSNVTKTLIHDTNEQNGNHSDTDHSFLNSKSSSTSKISINRKTDYNRGTQYRNKQNDDINSNHNSYTRSVEQLNNYCNSRRSDHYRRIPSDARSIKSLDFDNDFKKTNYSTEPRIRPTPPKKPLRLSLQRAQSLQTVEINDLDQKKRSLKRTHFAERIPETRLIENYTASLGRQKEYMKNI